MADGNATDEIQLAFLNAKAASTHGEGTAYVDGLKAALTIAEWDLRAAIAYRIRAELVCCDLYERTHASPASVKVGEGPHAICYWGEAAARIALAGER